MRLIVLLLDAAAGRSVLDAMFARGLPAVLVWTERTALTDGRVTLLVGARDQDVASVCATVAALAAVTDRAGDALMPLSEPTDLHLGRPSPPAAADLALYVLRVSRFEQMW